jgi:hypothetical protein
MTDNIILLQQEYVVVIDTNKPSFDFATQLCAYCTGHDDENSKDHTMVDKFYDQVMPHFSDNLKDRIRDNPFCGFLTDKMDQYGFYSPCTVWLNKNYGCNDEGEYDILTENNFDNFSLPAPLSVGFFFENEPNSELLALLKNRINKFFAEEWKSPVRFEGMRLITKTLYGSEREID